MAPQTSYLRSTGRAARSTPTYDALNRLTNHKTKAYVAGGTNAWVWTERLPEYDALGRIIRSAYSQYNDPGPGVMTFLTHAYSGSRLVQNVSSDGASFGARWHWAGAANEHWAPLKSPNPDTASQSGYNYAVGGSDVAGGGGAGGASPQRRTFVNPTTEGDQRHVFGQGRPMAKDAVHAATRGASLRAAAGRRVLARDGVRNRYQGTLSATQNANQNIVESRLFYAGTTGMSGGLDLSRSTDAREKGRVGIFGTAESYAGACPRVTSESIGRDLNPLGRGDGMGYFAGTMEYGDKALTLTLVSPPLPMSFAEYGIGNSVNNPCAGSPNDRSGDDGSGDGILPWLPHFPWPIWPPWQNPPIPPMFPPPGIMPPMPWIPPFWFLPLKPELPPQPGGRTRPDCKRQVERYKRAIEKYIYQKNPCNDSVPLPDDMAKAVKKALKRGVDYHYVWEPPSDPNKDPGTFCRYSWICGITPHEYVKTGHPKTWICCENCTKWPVVSTEDCALLDTVVHELIHAGDDDWKYKDYDPNTPDPNKADWAREQQWANCICGLVANEK